MLYPMPNFDFISSGLRTIRIESAAVTALSARLDDEFTKACDLILNCAGRVIVTGMGKSGHIGKKLLPLSPAPALPHFLFIRAKPVTATWA